MSYYSRKDTFGSQAVWTETQRAQYNEFAKSGLEN